MNTLCPKDAAGSAMPLSDTLIHALAERIGTPFWLYDGALIMQRIADIRTMTATPGLQARYAMKACPAAKILRAMRDAGIWIDAVSGNEALRALRAGHPDGKKPPVICFTSDVFRDNALEVVLGHGLLPNIGSVGMIDQLAAAGYRGPLSIRINPGFGHGHVNTCDTGGPSSKHGIWHEDLLMAKSRADRAGLEIVMLHAHIGSGPKIEELHENLTRLAQEFAALAPLFPQLEAVSLGGGIPHNYRDRDQQVDVAALAALFARCRETVVNAAGSELRVEIEPGRYYVAPACTLITRVHDIKRTRTNAKGEGATFAMVDAGFVDLVRPAMYGSYHHIEVLGKDASAGTEPIVVAGPLCESGDVFTRGGADEELNPRLLPRPERGDLLALRDAGAYGYAMSSNYNSIGRAPQIWVESDGSVEMISRRETIDDIVKAETSTFLSL